MRPASWFGTRLVPLIAGGFVAVLLYVIPCHVSIRILLIVLIDFLIIQAIFTVAEDRDY